MRQIFTALAAVFFLLQCHTSYNQTENVESDPTSDQITTADEELTQVRAEEKWKLSPRMHTFVQDMENEIIERDPTQSPHVLTTNLQTLLAQMISNHNAKGKAGEALEEWMSHFKRQLEQSHEISEQEAIEQLEMSIKAFRESFH